MRGGNPPHPEGQRIMEAEGIRNTLTHLLRTPCTQDAKDEGKHERRIRIYALRVENQKKTGKDIDQFKGIPRKLGR